MHWTLERAQRMKQAAERARQEDEELYGPPRGEFHLEPPGSGDGSWKRVLLYEEAFAAAGLCELWRLDWREETRFAQFSDFPPGFNFHSMWFRKAY